MTTTLEMENKFTRAVLFLGGIIALVFGLLLLTRTEGTIEVIMLLVGLWWMIQGVFQILTIFIDRSQWVWNLIGGILGVIAGLLVLNFPLAGGVVVIGFRVFFLGILGMLLGIASLVAAFQGAGWGAGIFGAVSLILGVLLMFNVALGAQILILIFAVLLIVQGLAALVLGFMFKN